MYTTVIWHFYPLCCAHRNCSYHVTIQCSYNAIGYSLWRTFYPHDLFISHNWKPVSPILLYPFCHSAPPWQPAFCSLYLCVYFYFLFICFIFYISHIGEIIQYLSYSARLISLNIMSSRFIQLSQIQDLILFFFFCWMIFHCFYIPYFLYPFIYGWTQVVFISCLL